MGMEVKHDMHQSNGQRANIVMKDEGAPVGEHLRSAAKQPMRNASATEQFAGSKSNDVITLTHGMPTSSRFLLAASPRRDERPTGNGLGGSVAQGQQGCCRSNSQPTGKAAVVSARGTI